MTTEEMVKKFQCPGCVNGSDPATCQHFILHESPATCTSHVCGTAVQGAGIIALGLPRGFNQCARPYGAWRAESRLAIRLWPASRRADPVWDRLNVAVWAMVENGFLFVRSVSPRIGRVDVDVVEGGTLEMVPDAIDVAQFIGEIS